MTGSLPSSPLETDATNQLNGSGGIGTLTYALVSGGNAATAGIYGTIQVNPNGSYTYTLTSAVRHDAGSRQRRQDASGAESFSYRVTDAHGNSATGTITVNIVDDVPTAHRSEIAGRVERSRGLQQQLFSIPITTSITMSAPINLERCGSRHRLTAPRTDLRRHTDHLYGL